MSIVNEKIDNLTALFQQKILNTEFEKSTLERLSKEVEESRDGLYQKLTLPYLRDLIDARESILQVLNRYGGAAVAGADSQALQEIAHVANMLGDKLQEHGVAIESVSAGQDFNVFKHRAVDKVPTADRRLHGKVAESKRSCYMLGETCVAQAFVKVFVCETRDKVAAQ